MAYKYILNPSYLTFKEKLFDIKKIFQKNDNTIHKARNEIKIIEINNTKCVVKAFKVPNLFNRIIYTFFKDGKAKKSYNNALRLKKLNVDTPDPIAIIEFYQYGLLSETYFISLYEPYDFTIREVFRREVENYKQLLKKFTEFTYMIHKKNVWHEDYTSGNILITKTNESYKFSLVDINRMKFRSISWEEGLSCFKKFWAREEDLKIISNVYSKLTKIDKQTSLHFLLDTSRKFQKKANIKKLFKKNKLFFIRDLIYKILPSSEVNTDVTFKYNKHENIQPILINELVLIKPIKNLILSMRKKTKKITIQREQKKLALVIPYRNREEHLKKFIPYMIEYLTQQNIQFTIIIVEQKDTKYFNKAKLMNIGALNAPKDTDYFIFHDVDLLPENIDYRYCNHSLKLFSYIKQEDETYKKYKQTNFGGAILVPKEVFLKINGFSNNYWQWGSEDDDFFMRHLLKGLTPLYDTNGKFIALPHIPSLQQDNSGNIITSKKLLKKNIALRNNNKKTLSKLKRALSLQDHDGVNDIKDYTLESIDKESNIHYIRVSF